MRNNSRAVYLFGNTLENFPTNKLPSNQQVFQRFYYIHSIDKQDIKFSANQTAKELINIWNLANIPTKEINEISRMVVKYFNEWNKLKSCESFILNDIETKKAITEKDERALKRSHNQKIRENRFKSNFNDLFDIASKDAFERMNVEEDIDFLLSQRKKGRPGCISNSIDRSYSILLDCSLSDIDMED